MGRVKRNVSMDNNQTVLSKENYSYLLQQISTLMKLTLSEIRYIYEAYPQCIMDFHENNVTEQSIEIRFDKEEVTVTCTFNPEGNCNIIYLFADKRETIERFIDYLKDSFDYDFIKSRWVKKEYYIKIKELTYLPYDIYLMFYS